jgi:hypothetical protein
MKLRFFYLDEGDRLHKVAQRHMEAAWWDERPWDDSAGTKLLRIITVICDDKLRPLSCFVMRLSVQGGRLTEESRCEAITAFQSGMGNILSGAPMPTELPLIDEQLEGWPETDTLFQQLAVALDVPIRLVPPLRFGGPLVTAAQLRVSIQQALAYYAEGAG